MTNSAKALIVARAAGVILGVLILQVTLGADIQPFGVQPELLLGLAASAGVTGGPDRGAIFGFGAGLAYDVFLQSPLGLTALVYAAIGYGTGSVQLGLASQSRGARMVSIGVASAAGVLAWVALAWVLDQSQPSLLRIVRVALVAATVNGLLAQAGARAARWVFAPQATVRMSSR